MAETLLVVESLDKVYGEGDAATHALARCQLRVGARRVRGHRRAVRLGQVHAAQPARPARHTDRRNRQRSTARASPSSTGRGARACATSSSASSSSSTTCCPSSRCSRTSRCPRSSAGSCRPPRSARESTRHSRCSASRDYDEKNANQLSGGQKQRVAIARALMNRPALRACRRAHRQPRHREHEPRLRPVPGDQRRDGHRVPDRHPRPRTSPSAPTASSRSPTASSCRTCATPTSAQAT